MMVYDHEWKHPCMLCTEVPSLEAGTVAIEPLADGGEGMAVSYAPGPAGEVGGRHPDHDPRRGLHLGGRAAPAVPG